MIDIPLYKHPVEIHFTRFIRKLGEHLGWDYRDMGGKYKWEQETRERLCAEHGIDYNVWGKKPYNEMDADEKAFHDVYRAEMAKAPPYLDAWHWLADHAFDVTGNGCSTSLSSEYIEPGVYEEGEVPKHAMTVIRAIFDAVPEDHPARDEDGINFYITW